MHHTDDPDASVASFALSNGAAAERTASGFWFITRAGVPQAQLLDEDVDRLHGLLTGIRAGRDLAHLEAAFNAAPPRDGALPPPLTKGDPRC